MKKTFDTVENFVWCISQKIPPSREIIFRLGGYIFNQRLSLFNISQLPAQRTGSQHSSIRVFQFGHHQFGLALVNHQDIVINSFLDRLEDVISGLSQPTEQNNCFGTGESNEVCNSLSQNSTGKVKNILCQLVTLNGCCLLYTSDAADD